MTTPEKGVRIAQELFGLKIEKGVKEARDVIGSLEEIKIIAPTEMRHLWASINPIVEGSILDKKLAEELGLMEKTESGQLKVKFSLGSKRIQTLVYTEDLSDKDFSMIIGKRDLQGFLIDPMKGKNKVLKLPVLLTGSDEEVPFFEADRELTDMDRKLKLLWHLKPANLKEESEKFLADPFYDPQFEYRKLAFDSHELKIALKKIEESLDDSPLGRLFQKKAQEHLKKIWLLEARGKEDFTNHSFELYGKPSESLVLKAREKLEGKPRDFVEPGRYFSVPEAIVEFERVFQEYGLDHWRIKVNKHMVSACSAGKECTLFITAENGKHQIYGLFNRGFGNFLETQEGLAIWNQERVSTVDNEKNYRSATLIFVLEFARKHGFAETYDYCLKLGMTPDRALQTTLKVKRGMKDTSKPGVFTKDGLYFSGYLQVQNFVVNGGNLKDLYYGKYNLEDLPLIKKIPGLKEPRILPHFLSA